jgi:hypothetical protein
MDERRAWPPILGLFKSVIVALTYMRRNRVQAELAETYEVSQSTISRAISEVTPLLGKVLAEYVPTADEFDERTQYIVDGALLPCWSWALHPELYSGKHKTIGMNVQVACTLAGSLRHTYCTRYASSNSSTTATGLTRASPTPDHYTHYYRWQPIRPRSPVTRSTDAPVWAASSTSTSMPPELHG